MGASVEGITARIKAALRDANQDSWPEDVIHLSILEAERVIVNFRPDATAVSTTLDLVAGIEQSLAGLTNPPANRLLEVKHNVVGTAPGRGVRRVAGGDVDAIAPDWRSAPASAVIKEFIHDPREPLLFYVRPPAATGAKLRVSYSAIPAPYGTVNSGTQTTVSEVFEPMIIEHALYRLFGHDTEGSVNVARSQAHLNNFNNWMGTKIQGEAVYGPKNMEHKR